MDGIQDALGGFWGNVSQKFSNNDHVLGYELINEPSWGDFWTHPFNWFTGHTDKTYLEPMYDNLASYIRAQDEEHNIFFEPV